MESFHIGLRVRWVVSKTHKEWLDGYITKVAIEMGHPGCVLTIFQVGKAKQDTYKVVHFPTGVHEINLPPVPPHLQLSQTYLQEGFSISFRYNEVWGFGWVIKLTKHTCHLEILNGKTSIFLRSQMYEVCFIQIPRKFVYGGSWKDVTGESYNPGKIPFTGDSSIRFTEQLRAMDPSDLYFAALEWEQNSVLDPILEATNESGRYYKDKGIKEYNCWPANGITKNDIKEMIRIRIGMDLVNGRTDDFFSKSWTGQSKKGGIVNNVPYRKFKLVHARFRAHTIEDERAARWIFKFARYRFDIFCGSRPTLQTFITIANSLKGAGRKLSKDESMFDTSSLKGQKSLIRSRGKNHDYGRMVRRLCGSARGCEGVEENATASAENHQWVGAGYTHNAVFEAGEKYYQPSTYEVHGKGYGLMFSLLTENHLFLGKGHEVYVDSYFLRNPVCSLCHTKLARTNVAGTIRKDATNLPEKSARAAMRKQVSSLSRGRLYEHGKQNT